MTSIIWNHTTYKQSEVNDFFGFIAWLCGKDEFILIIGDRWFKCDCSYDGWAYMASTSNYDGPGDNINLATGSTRAEAIESLVEKLSEAIYEEKI